MTLRLKSLPVVLLLLVLSGVGISVVGLHDAIANRKRVPLITLRASERVSDDAPFAGALASATSANDKQLYILRRDTGNIVVRDSERRRARHVASFASAPRALAVGAEGRMYLATESEVRVVDAAGQTVSSFPAPSPSSIAALNDGRVIVASPASDRLLNVYDSAGRLSGRMGKPKRLDAGNPAQNNFLNRGKVAASPSGEIYYVSTFAAAPTVQKFSGGGRLLSEFAIEGDAVGLQLRRAKEFLGTKSQDTVGGFQVITSAAVDPATGHLWVGMNGSSRHGSVSPDSGVVYEYDAGGTKLAEYAFTLAPPVSPPGVITDVRDIAVSLPWIHVLTSEGQIYRFNLNDRVALNDGGYKGKVGEGLRGSLARAFWASGATPVSPARQSTCPAEQPFTCVANCPSGSTPTTRDCAAEIKSRLSQGDRIITNSCSITQATPGGCSGSATSCNTSTGVRVSYSVSLECNAAPPPETGGGGGGGCNGPCDGTMYENGYQDPCTCEFVPYSPIVIDVAGDGFDLTDVGGGVAFDLNGDGVSDQISWTVAGSDDAWLALDRDGSGSIDDGAELFGNFTPQPPSAAPNGFLALAGFDQPANGGNGDGLIDGGDSIFPSLRLWRDVNHNGVSEPNELHPLPSLGVTALAFDYREARKQDKHGNQFRYRAKAHGNARTGAARWAYDVFLLAGP